ncbi:MAG: winged helix-turn-helix transcriptional regulator [Pseudomonadota bacterium]|nr:MAG: winged helix-turn-helix transcriptional regulator [Pseudomonadota bacterium]
MPIDNRIAEVARALAHPARVRIVRLLLDREQCIGGDIVDEVGLAQSTVSEHMRILKQAGIVVAQFERPRVRYALSSEHMGELAELLGRVRDCC